MSAALELAGSPWDGTSKKCVDRSAEIHLILSSSH